MFHCLENWTGSRIMRSTVNIAINTACEIGKVSPELTAVLNLPFRALNMISSQRKTSVLGGFMETFAFAALFLPSGGRQFSIGIDLTSMLFSYIFADRDEAPNRQPLLHGKVDMEEERIRFDGRIRSVVFGLASNHQENDHDAILSTIIKVGEKYEFFSSLRETRVFLKEAMTKMSQVVEVSDKVVLEQTIKKTKGEIQALVKQLPVFGLAVATLLAIRRISRGQLWRGVGEVASGVAGCFPGCGTVISIGLDVVICGLDIRDARNDHLLLKEHNVDVLLEKVPLNIPAAYRILGFGSNVHPGREELQTAHNRLYVIISKGCMKELAEISGEKIDEGTAGAVEYHQRREEVAEQEMQRGFLVLQKIQRLLGLEEFVPEVQ